METVDISPLYPAISLKWRFGSCLFIVIKCRQLIVMWVLQ